MVGSVLCFFHSWVTGTVRGGKESWVSQQIRIVAFVMEHELISTQDTALLWYKGWCCPRCWNCNTGTPALKSLHVHTLATQYIPFNLFYLIFLMHILFTVTLWTVTVNAHHLMCSAWAAANLFYHLQTLLWKKTPKQNPAMGNFYSPHVLLWNVKG